jgi:hypothetical protein
MVVTPSSKYQPGAGAHASAWGTLGIVIESELGLGFIVMFDSVATSIPPGAVGTAKLQFTLLAEVSPAAMSLK